MISLKHLKIVETVLKVMVMVDFLNRGTKLLMTRVIYQGVLSNGRVRLDLWYKAQTSAFGFSLKKNLETIFYLKHEILNHLVILLSVCC